MTKFAGFDKAAPQFFHELAAQMNREWFEANKPRYQQQWVEPLTALLDEVAARLGKAYAPAKLGAPKLFRIYRDTRFAKDKSPYKTHVAGVIPLAGKKPAEGGCSAMYLHLGLEAEFIGVGSYYFDDKQLARWRKLVAADQTGKAIAGIVGKLRKRGYQVGGHEDYKKVPKGFAPDHARAEFLKMRGLTAGFPEIPRGMLHRAKLADWLVEHGKATAPMVTWLYQHVK
ncbi:MAG TPA: TIGR02453 family protein [Kofleriaceae bacterium]|jgi:uncharacterized protein (TIGR02453 family)